MRYSLKGTGKGVPGGERRLSVRGLVGEKRHDGLNSETGHGSNICPLDRLSSAGPPLCTHKNHYWQIYKTRVH